MTFARVKKMCWNDVDDLIEKRVWRRVRPILFEQKDEKIIPRFFQMNEDISKRVSPFNYQIRNRMLV